MWRAGTAWAVCLLSVVAAACVPRRPAPTPELSFAPPAPPPVEGEQSIADLDRSLRSGGPALMATLLRSERASDRSAGVKVTVAGIGLVDPAVAGEEYRFGQGHLHYRLDDGPVIATTATKISFHDLEPGRHTVTVMLAGNDDRPLGPKRVLRVYIPGADKPSRAANARARRRATATATARGATTGAARADAAAVR
jgi:hypothetical protein